MHSSAVFLIEFGCLILGLGLLGRLAGRLSFSPIPLYLLAGLACHERAAGSPAALGPDPGAARGEASRAKAPRDDGILPL